MKLHKFSLTLLIFFTINQGIVFPTQLQKPQSVELIKSKTNLAMYPNFNNEFWYRSLPEYQGKKIVHYLYTTNKIVWHKGHATSKWFIDKHPLSSEDASRYQKNNIVVRLADCELDGANVQEQEGSLLRSFLYHTFGFGDVPLWTWHAYSLCADNNTIINIFISKTFGCDARFYATPHKGRIAILVDEEGFIVSILDNVASEDEIFTAFNVRNL